jgi:ABC-type methionine transport system permease subunit
MVGLAGSGGLASLLSSFGRERGEKLASVLAAFLLLLMTV